MMINRILVVLMGMALLAWPLPVKAQDREDPDESLNGAELAIAHGMVDDMLATALTDQMERTVDEMLEGAPPEPSSQTAIKTAFRARLPKLISQVQDWVAQAIVDEFTHEELLNPDSIPAARWSNLADGARDTGIEFGMRFMIEVIDDVCAPEDASAFCERARDVVADEDQLNAVRERARQ
ncbi:hypothetical protein [Brevundimonas subvibrioides]|uniref:hypothetical protein n=1 Tax=Brevundimonas subvibrioides TaxID=74313 RepID=UPI0022B35DAF|nr:hypothetical protein [Brevundimonas subvibrioides]